MQTHIGRFGSDPARVMLFGGSAGGVTVCALLASRPAPMMIGTNADEALRMVPATPLMDATYQTAARSYLVQYALTAAQTDAVLAAYPSASAAAPRAALVALITDTRWTCPARAIARAVRGAQTESVYRYFVTKTRRPDAGPGRGESRRVSRARAL